MALISELDIVLRAKVDKLPADFKTGKDTATKFKNELETMGGSNALAGMFTKALPQIAIFAGATYLAKQGLDLVVTSAAGFAEVVAQTMDDIDTTSDQAKKLGMSFSELVLVRKSLGETSGLDSEAIDASMQRLQINLYESASGTGQLYDMLARLGIDSGELIKMGPTEQMKVLSKAIEGVKNPTEQLKIAYELFGKQGAALVQSLREGPEAVDEMNQHLARTGMLLTDAQAEQVGAAQDAWGRVGDIATGVMMQISAELAPHMKVVADEAYTLADGFLQGQAPVEQTLDLFVSLGYKVWELGEGASSFVSVFTQASPIVLGITEGIQSAVNTVKGFSFMAQAGVVFESEGFSEHQKKKEAAKAEAERVANVNLQYKNEVDAELAKIDAEKKVAQIEEQKNKAREDQLDKLREELQLQEEIANLREKGLDSSKASAMAKDIMDARKAEKEGMSKGQLAEMQSLQDARRQYQDEQKAADEAQRLKDSLKTPEERNAEQLDKYREMYQQGRLGLEDFRRAVGSIAEKIVPAKTEQSIMSARTAEGWKFMNQGRADSRQREIAEFMKQTAFQAEMVKLQQEANQALANIGVVGRIR